MLSINQFPVTTAIPKLVVFVVTVADDDDFAYVTTRSKVRRNKRWHLFYQQLLYSYNNALQILERNAIAPALVSYFCSSVAKALHLHRKSVGSIPAGGPIVDSFFSTVSGLNLGCVCFLLEIKTLKPLGYTSIWSTI